MRGETECGRKRGRLDLIQQDGIDFTGRIEHGFQCAAHLQRFGTEFRRLAKRNEAFIPMAGGFDVALLPSPVQSPPYRRLERADVETQEVCNPGQRTVLVPDGPLVHRPFHSLRVGIGANRQHRTRQSQQLRQCGCGNRRHTHEFAFDTY